MTKNDIYSKNSRMTHAEKWAENVKSKIAQREFDLAMEENKKMEKEANKYLTRAEIRAKNEWADECDLIEHGNQD